MSNKISQDLQIVLEALTRLPDRVQDDFARLRALEVLQRRVVRLVADLPSIKESFVTGEELPAWERICRKIEAMHPDRVDHVDEIADVQVPIVGSDRSLHVAPPQWVTAWTTHAVSIVRVLLETTPDVIGTMAPNAELSVESERESEEKSERPPCQEQTLRYLVENNWADGITLREIGDCKGFHHSAVAKTQAYRAYHEMCEEGVPVTDRIKFYLDRGKRDENAGE